MSIKRVYIISASGIKNAAVGTPSYDFPTIIYALESALPNHTQVKLPVNIPADYSWDKSEIQCFVAPSRAARANFLRLCRLTETTPENCVFAVHQARSDELISLHRTYETALERSKDDINTYIALQEIEE